MIVGEQPLLTVFFVVISTIVVCTTFFIGGVNAILLTMIAWFFIPNWATHLMGINDVPVFFYFQTFQAFALLFVIGKALYLGQTNPIPKLEKWIFFLFSFAYILQITIGTYVLNHSYHTSLSSPNLPNPIIVHHYVGDALFLVLFGAFITLVKTVEDIEKLLKIILLTAVLLSIEMIVTYNVPLVRFTLGFYTLNELQQFQSVFLNDTAAVPLYSSMGFICCVYFLIKKRQIRYLPLALLCLLVPVYSFVRSILLGLCGAGIFFGFLLTLTHRKAKFLLATSAVLLCLAAFLVPFGRNALMSVMPNKRMSFKVANSNSLDSTYTRIGSAIRGIQILNHSFPFGIGPLMERYVMPTRVPPYLEPQLLPGTENGVKASILDGYDRVTSRNVEAEVQIGLFSVMLSYGITGLSVALLFMILLGYTTYRTLRETRERFQMFLLATTLATLLAGNFIFYMFNTTPLLSLILLAAIHGIFLLRQETTRLIPDSGKSG